MTPVAPSAVSSLPPPSASARLLVFTKPAVAGRVKTRLIGALTAEQAAELHAAFVGDVCDRLADGVFEKRIAWAVEEDEVLPSGRFLGQRQEGRDLGERLFNGLVSAARQAERVAAVGSDHPELPLSVVEEAFTLLRRGADVVLGPAEDGGYYLIGLRRGAVHEELFRDIPWSTGAVLATTLARAAELGLAVEVLPTAADVDRPADLERLARSLAAGGDAAVPCPRTRRLLDRWGLLRASDAASGGPA